MLSLFSLIYMFIYSLFSVSNHALTLRSKAAILSHVCVPLLFAQTGYYDFPKSGSILIQATLIILIVICLDLHHIPSSTLHCMQMCDLFSYSCFLVGAMKHGCWSHSLWWKHFPTRPFHPQILAFHFRLFCRVSQVWKMHFCLVFNVVFFFLKKKPHSYHKLSYNNELIRCCSSVTFYRKSTTLWSCPGTIKFRVKPRLMHLWAIWFGWSERKRCQTSGTVLIISL